MAFDVGSIVAHIQADLSGFTQGVDEAQQQAESFGTKVGNVADSIRSFAEKAAIFVTAETIGFEQLAQRAIEVASNFEQTQTSFGTLLGSEQKAADLMKEIMQFEIHTPFDIQTLTNGAKAMLAFGVNSKDVVPIMKELTDMSQGQADRLNELISIYGQVNSIQQLNGREVLRLSSIGIPIYQAIEDHFKKIGDTSMDSGEKVKQAITDGTITSQVFNDVLVEMTSKGGLFFNENIRQMKTFAGIISSTQSQIQYAFLNLIGIDLGAANEVRKGGLFDTLRTMAANLLEWLNKLQPVFKALGENKTFQLAIEGMVLALVSLAVIIPIVIIVLNPIILVVLAIEAAIVALYVAWNSNFLGIRDITNSVATFIVGIFNDYLKPAIQAFSAWWAANWAYIREVLQGEWDMIVGIFKLAWAIVIGIFKIYIDLITGNWVSLWNDVKTLLGGAWEDIKNILNGALEMIAGWGGKMVSALVKPFQDAWDAISGLITKIKNGLDFTQRHSPSVIDIVEMGVQKVNDALGGLAFNGKVSLNPMGGIGSPALIGTSGTTIQISMDGAIIADANSAMAMGEKIGDAIVKKLQMNIRV